MVPVSAPSNATWAMPRLVKGSVGLHVLAAGTAALAPQHAFWALGSIAANHLVLTGAGLWPRSRLLGPNISRLAEHRAVRGEICLTIDDGPDPEVTPLVLDLLDALKMTASFFCIAERATRHAALTRQILARGHAVENHSLRHRHNFSLLGPGGYRDEIGRAQQSLFDVTGRWPAFFRAPAGLRNPFLDPVLHRLGLRLVSWTRRGFDTRERNPARVLHRLERGLAGGDILLLHDGHAARAPDARPVLLHVLPRLNARARESGLRWVRLGESAGGDRQPAARLQPT